MIPATHPFDSTRAAQSGLYPAAESPMRWCAPSVTVRDKDGRDRYPMLLARWNCPECGAGWEFTQTTSSGLCWVLVGQPVSDHPPADWAPDTPAFQQMVDEESALLAEGEAVVDSDRPDDDEAWRV